jgi:predicted Zn-dependent protease with MMP-like domain
MTRQRFEEIAEDAFDHLPDELKLRVENVQVVVEDYPTPEQLRRVRLKSREQLLGLYEGVPLSQRGTWYGITPTLPDRISLFQMNIEAVCRTENEVEQKIRAVLIHEIAHHFGMDEQQIQKAGY